ncbi:MAG: Uncharacterised protein [Cryomorphaceae bacterium]|nr:YdeI/OmpD-associated family protein [Cryomorphaceae bacterium]CAI8171548.1 MAG: Uncharacterised protein [Cryomorphaceae bacterium]
MAGLVENKRIEVKSITELHHWLLSHHISDESWWLVTYKKAVIDKYVDRWDVLDELICFGWIDGVRKKLDEQRTMQLISKRKVQHWAKSYKERAALLTKEGRMHSSGLKSVEEGKTNGLWHFMDDVDNLIIPNDLETSLKSAEGAFEFFDQINDSSKRNSLRWLKLAKTEKTRQKRLLELTRLSAQGEKLPGS